MAGIFLSYSRADRESAFRIVQGLRALGVDVWWDEDMPGVDWQYELEQRINEMAAVLVLWSVHSKSSKPVRDEARLGDRHDKLVNVLLGVAEPPHPFDRNNGLPIDGWDGFEPHNGWRRLVQTAETFLVKAGDKAPGEVVAAYNTQVQEREARKEALASAQEDFAAAQQAVTDAEDLRDEARAATVEAEDDLARAAAARLSPTILRAAQAELDSKAAALEQTEAGLRAARAARSEISRRLKRLTDALARPADVIPATPIVSSQAVTPVLPDRETPPAPSTKPDPPVNPRQDDAPAAPDPIPVDRTDTGPDKQSFIMFTELLTPRNVALGVMGGLILVALISGLQGVAEKPSLDAPPADGAAVASATPSPAPAIRPGDWLIGDWVINQSMSGCKLRLQVTRGASDNELVFTNPDVAGASGPDVITQVDSNSLTTSSWRYTRKSDGLITMQSLANPAYAQELSKCAS